jgi:hypothetical protein
MIHEENPVIKQIHKARTNGLMPCCLEVKHLATNSYVLTDREGVTYGNFSSYKEAEMAKKLTEGITDVL